MNDDAREQFFYFKKVDQTRANDIRALHEGSRVTMVDGTGKRLADEQIFTGDHQASPDSNCESTGAHTSCARPCSTGQWALYCMMVDLSHRQCTVPI